MFWPGLTANKDCHHIRRMQGIEKLLRSRFLDGIIAKEFEANSPFQGEIKRPEMIYVHSTCLMEDSHAT